MFNSFSASVFSIIVNPNHFFPRAFIEAPINVPANPRHYWRYRMHLTVEQLQAAEEFNSAVSNMIKSCGRN